MSFAKLFALLVCSVVCSLSFCILFMLFSIAGKVSQWKDRFTAEQNEYFDKLFEEKMEYCDLVKDYRQKGGATH